MAAVTGLLAGAGATGGVATGGVTTGGVTTGGITTGAGVGMGALGVTGVTGASVTGGICAAGVGSTAIEAGVVATVVVVVVEGEDEPPPHAEIKAVRPMATQILPVEPVPLWSWIIEIFLLLESKLLASHGDSSSHEFMVKPAQRGGKNVTNGDDKASDDIESDHKVSDDNAKQKPSFGGSQPQARPAKSADSRRSGVVAPVGVKPLQHQLASQ